MILIAVLFILPIYYVARSKGYNGTMFAAIAAVLALGSMVMAMGIPGQGIEFLQIVLPALMLGIVALLEVKPGAPGKAYLKISFTCPECKEEVTFTRSNEGSPQLCPKCGEIITVPLDEFSLKPNEHVKEKPDIASGPVCFDSFSDEMCALQLNALLQENGIKSELIGDTGGGMLPQLGETQGFKIVIDIDDWDKAVEIEKTANQALEFTPDGATHH